MLYLTKCAAEYNDHKTVYPSSMTILISLFPSPNPIAHFPNTRSVTTGPIQKVLHNIK